MSFAFGSFQVVPKETIIEIGEAIALQYVKNLKTTNTDLEQVILKGIIEATNKVADSEGGEATVDGYTLNSMAVELIASYLNDGKKVMTIREFRAETGAELRDAKNFIDQFGVGRNAFVKFKMAFNSY